MFCHPITRFMLGEMGLDRVIGQVSDRNKICLIDVLI